MKVTFSLPGGLAVIYFIATSQAHTWLEDLRLIGSNGSFVGDVGFPRAYVSRTGSVNPNDALVYRLGPKDNNTNTLMCGPLQTVGNQNPGFPALKAAPGDNVAMRYLENGHVTKLEPGRPARSGTIFVYGTKTPSNDDRFLNIHRVWNAAGTGGDKRGRLIATRPYDDGQCYQVNPASAISVERQNEFPKSDPNSDLKCQTDIQIPADAGTSGEYTLYWVWEWPLLAPTGQVATMETYTACADIELTANSVKSAGAGSFIAGQDITNVAIKEQLQNQYILNPAAHPALSTAPPFEMAPTPTGTPAGSSPSDKPTATPSASDTTTTATRRSKTSSPPAQGFVTVTVTPAPVTVTEYIIIKPDATTIAKSVITETPAPSLTPLPEDDFLAPSSSSRSSSSTTTTKTITITTTEDISEPSQTPAPVPSGRPSAIRPFLPSGSAAESQLPSPTSTTTTTKAGGVYHETQTLTPTPTPTPTAAAPSNNATPTQGSEPYVKRGVGRGRRRVGRWYRP